MSKRSSRSQRDVSTVASDLSSLLASPVSPSSVMRPLSELQDDRFYAPDPIPVARSVSGLRRHRLVLAGQAGRSARQSQTKSAIVFHNSHGVVLCVRRKRRREVLFAKKRTQKGSASRFRRKSHFSDVGCK